MRFTRKAPINCSPEVRLILACARPHLDAKQAKELRSLAQAQLDWTSLWETAARQGQFAMLYWHLKAHCPRTILADWSLILSGAFEDAARRNTYLTVQLLRILELFESKGIFAIPYKGPALTIRAYGNLALRRYQDLDFAVRHRDVVKASQALVSEGFRAEIDPNCVSSGHGERVPGQYYFEMPDGSCIVELHTERTLRYFPVPLDLDDLARRLESIPVGGRAIRTFSAEDLLTILSVHATKHLWTRLVWVSDIAGLIENSPAMDWEAAEERARQTYSERMFYSGLSLAHDLLGVSAPEEILQHACSVPAVQTLTAYAKARLCAKILHQTGLLGRFQIRRKTPRGTWRGLRYAFRLGVSPTEEDWGASGLATDFNPLGRFSRPFRLLRAHGLFRGSDSARVGYEPTPVGVVEEMLAMAELRPGDTVYDLGSGDGRIVIFAAKKYGVRAVGVELDARLVAEARRNARQQGLEDRVSFIHADYLEVDLSSATVVTLYLTFFAVRRLQTKLERELPCGARVIGRDLEMIGWPAERTKPYFSADRPRETLRVWRVTAPRKNRVQEPCLGRAAQVQESH